MLHKQRSVLDIHYNAYRTTIRNFIGKSFLEMLSQYKHGHILIAWTNLDGEWLINQEYI